MNAGEKNLRFADALVGSLAILGARHFVVSPGSRSTALAAAVARCPGIEPHVRLDERGAAFFAQGIAKAAGCPAVLICTSGTAAANYLPGIVEAAQSETPLVALTADRPAELQDCGAPQTIDQKKIYGSAVRFFHECPLPANLADPASYGASLALQAWSAATLSRPGPVHLNLPFAEPFLPGILPAFPAAPRLLAPTRPRRTPPADVVERLAGLIRERPRGWIVAGPLSSGGVGGGAGREGILRLSAVTGYPILADSASGLRAGERARACVLSYADAWLREPDTASLARPDLVLRVGAQPSSKVLAGALAGGGILQILLAEWESFTDPARQAAGQVIADWDLLADELGSALGTAIGGDPQWRGRLGETDEVAGAAIEAGLQGFAGLGEAATARALVRDLPEGACLFVSNSMPVRDLDWFGGSRKTPLRIFANRGANGIDGILSSALGVAAAGRSPTYLLTGDLAFLHDVGALAAVPRGASLGIVVVNNSGGGIFQHLPIRDSDELFEKYFATPHELDFESISRAFGARFVRVTEAKAFSEWLSSGEEGPRICEIPREAAQSRRERESLWEAASAALSRRLPSRKAAAL